MVRIVRPPPTPWWRRVGPVAMCCVSAVGFSAMAIAVGQWPFSAAFLVGGLLAAGVGAWAVRGQARLGYEIHRDEVRVLTAFGERRLRAEHVVGVEKVDYELPLAERRHGVPGYRVVRCMLGDGSLVTTYVAHMKGRGLKVLLATGECLLLEPEDPEPLLRALGGERPVRSVPAVVFGPEDLRRAAGFLAVVVFVVDAVLIGAAVGFRSEPAPLLLFAFAAVVWGGLGAFFVRLLWRKAEERLDAPA